MIVDGTDISLELRGISPLYLATPLACIAGMYESCMTWGLTTWAFTSLGLAFWSQLNMIVYEGMATYSVRSKWDWR